ncbi:UMP kinase [Candidatus Bathyarchaeota archaeon]|nr:UMP kinase [Candidatus Bathyarchaeota archaeon]
MDEAKKVLKIGGSLLFGETLEVNESRIKDFIELITEYRDSIAAVIVGGGKVARLYINALASMHGNQSLQDMLGIEISRINARMLASMMGNENAYQGIPRSARELLELRSILDGKIVFTGGFEVGQSTTSVACEVAEILGNLQLIIGTDVDGVYDKDPGKHPDARKLEKVTPSDIISILGIGSEKTQKAGEYRILDTVSLSIIMRSNLNVRIVKGDTGTLKRALKGEHVGTRIQYEEEN